MSDSAQGKGGRARAQRLSAEQRSEIARKGALAKHQNRSTIDDTNAIPWAVAEGELKIGGVNIPCAVLDNGKRVLSQQGMLLALGRARAAKGGEGASVDEGPAFLRASNLKPFVSNELEASTKAIMYKPESGGYTPHKGWLAIAYGYDAECFPEILKVFIAASKANKLHYTQAHIAEIAERLFFALPQIAMIALVDEATGYQDIRAHNELQAILEAYVLPEHRPWAQKVPIEFTKELYRVYGWNYTPDNRGPRYASKLIRNLLYKPLPPPVLPELDRLNPPDKNWQRKRRHHQHLTAETGLEQFKALLSGVMALLRATPDGRKDYFWRLYKRSYSDQRSLDLGDDE